MELLGGPLFAVAGAGESHGPGVVTIVFGCPPGLWLERQRIQAWLDRRRPGGTRHGTPRRESDRVTFLAGLYQDDHDRLTAGPTLALDGDDPQAAATYDAGYTTGEPIAAVVLSTAGRAGAYEQFRGPTGAVRPGHTDLVKHYQSGGFVDIRGGGRSSYRSTISDVIGGGIARLYLERAFGTVFLSSVVGVGPLRAERTLAAAVAELGPRIADEQVSALSAALDGTWDEVGIPTIDAAFAAAAADLIKQTRVAGDSLGAVVEVVGLNVPALAGDPLYHSLKLRLMGSLGGLHAAQACEIGDGAAVAGRRGSENNDPIRGTGYARNSHGGLIGGITTGNPLVARVAFKPTSSIARPQQSVRKDLAEIDFELRKGRHDPCVGVRAGVTLESRMAIEVMNAVLMHAARHVDPADFDLFPTEE
ncbi:chorismate synthase [Promineifilum sp.]|uniref:chorismate synthase n=1 Tax=Promineifilum sp. TaxID=2664178 RepID=UPI0035B0A8B6